MLNTEMTKSVKKIIFLFVVFSFFFVVSGAFAQQQEKIDNFDVTININADAIIRVREFIRYDFDGLQRHGIFRDIPIKYAARGGNFSLRISDISVNDENGNEYKFSVSYPGNNVEIKIGDPDILVSGQKIYVINYTINRAINYFSDHDELYWNATGNEWPVPIEKSSAQIILPSPILKQELQAACFAGAFGSQTPCASIDYIYNADGLVSAINFNQPSALGAGQGLTIVAGWPKGIVAKPSVLQNIFDIIKDNLILVLPLITLIVMFYLWWTRGRDPKGRGTIYAQYDAPDNLTPVETGTLIDEKVDTKDISSEIIYLATKGYLKITRTENKGIIFKSEDYLLEKLKDQADLPSFDKQIMDGLFQHGDHQKIKLSELKNAFYKQIKEINDKVYDSLVAKGYFPKSPAEVKYKYFLIVSIALFAIFLVSVLAALGNINLIALAISAFIVIIFGFYMPVKTKKGVDTKENILGLKEYLEVAEKDRIKFHNAPEKNPEHFEKLLPYAMVLGVEKEWAEKFKDIYNQPPSWYSDPSGGTFNSLILISSLNNFNHSANAALFTAPHSAASGGSGFGGGGFSGGGFGGGGGGSW